VYTTPDESFQHHLYVKRHDSRKEDDAIPVPPVAGRLFDRRGAPNTKMGALNDREGALQAGRTLFVANVPATASQDSFSRLFAECGVVESVTFGVLKEGTEPVGLDDFVAGAVLDGAPTVIGPTGRDGSFAYVVFTEPEGVDAVLRLRQADRYMLDDAAAGVWGMAGASSPGCTKWRRGTRGS